MLQKAKVDLGYRAAVKELFHRDILFAYNAFFYTYDPRKRPFHHIPFLTWDFQDETILSLVFSIKNKEDLVLEKSRDMGATWIILTTFFHCWLDPAGGMDFLVGSRTRDYVDVKGDPRTHFFKLRYLLARLPRWLVPEGFKPREHDTYCKLVNPETGAAITGESNNENFSTQGRFSSVFFDEFAKWESTDTSAWTAAGDATPCRIAASTPFGAGGKYYDLVTDGKTKRITLHWPRHPEKAFGLSCIWPPPNEKTKATLKELWKPLVKLTSPWYEAEKKRRTSDEIKQELDLDYLGSGSPVFGGEAMEALQLYHKLPDEPIAFGEVDLEKCSIKEIDYVPENWEGYLIIYERFDPRYSFCVGWDIVEGVEGGDFLVGTVLNRMTKDVAAKYFSQEDEVTAARIIKAVNDFFSPELDSAYAPWCGIETNGPGLATFDLCMMLGMTNLFLSPRYDVVNATVSYKKGFRTDTVSRNELIAGVKGYLLDQAGKLNSQRLVGELMTFVRSKTGRPQAKSGCHDDEVFSFGIVLQIDALAPLDFEQVKRARPVIPGDVFVRFSDEDLKIEGEDTSVEGKCLATALRSRDIAEHEELAKFYGEAYY